MTARAEGTLRAGENTPSEKRKLFNQEFNDYIKGGTYENL